MHFLMTPGFKYTTWMRFAGYARKHRLLRMSAYPIAKAILLRLRHKYGIAIPEYTRIGPGLKIEGWQNIMVNGDAVIGSNCTLSPFSMLGQSNRGAKQGSPTLEDGVTLLDGAKATGAITIGRDSLVLHNSVVSRDLPAGCVAVGVPAKPITWYAAA